MPNVVSQHRKILYRFDFRHFLSCGSNYSQSTNGNYKTAGFYMEAAGYRFVQKLNQTNSTKAQYDNKFKMCFL